MRKPNPGLALALTLFATAASGQDRPGWPLCGSMSAGPYTFHEYGIVQRSCAAPAERQYRPRNAGIGFEALDLEREACAVPDDAYRLLDEIVDAVASRTGMAPSDRQHMAAYVETVSRVTDTVLTEKGFGQFSPTHSLGHALLRRSGPQEPPRYATDGNASALILLTVAQALKLPASLVAVTEKGAQRFFVRWQTEPAVDWDMAMHSQCDTLDDHPDLGPYAAYDGKPLTRDQTLYQLLLMRGGDWIRQSQFDKAIADYERAIPLFPTHPVALNNYAWLVATGKSLDGTSRLETAAQYADRLLSIDRSPEYLDTAACVRALAGDFKQAAALEREALQTVPHDEILKARLKQFSEQPPRDCTGAP